MRLLILALSFLTFVSCTKILLKAYGVKNPDIENAASLQKYVERKNIGISEYWGFKDTLGYIEYIRSRIGMPEARFFDKNLNLIRYKPDSVSCNAKVFSVLENPSILKEMVSDTSETINDYLKNVINLSDKSPAKFDANSYDFYVILYWARWSGRINKTKIRDWIRKIETANHNGYKIKIIPINTDIQDFWGMEKPEIEWQNK